MLKFKVSSVAMLASLAAAGCAGKSAGEEQADRTAESAGTEAQSTILTTKTGPAIEAAFALRNPVNPGETGVITVTIRDGYDAGTLTVTASSKTGLGVFPTSQSASFNMQGDTAHQWDVYFKTDIAGAHYLDIHVMAADDSGATIGARSFSYRADVGAAAPASSKTESAPAVTDSNGEKKIIMDAEETIVTEPQ